MDTEVELEQQSAGRDRDITLLVHTTRGSATHTFAATAKIKDVIDVLVTAFGFNAGDGFQLTLAANPGDPLDPNRPLVSYHLIDGTEVVLTAVGTGV